MILAPFEGPLTGAANMRRDLAMWETVHRGDVDVLMRTYTWDPWCVSLGKHQAIDVVDASAVRELGFDVVHRPTGGRAVLHADELTYCLVVRLADGRSAQDVYAAAHTLIVNALRQLDLPELSFQDVPTDLRQHYAASGAAGASCFTSSARSEIMARGKKVVGSAQRVMDGIVLQHGSILCGSGHERLAEVLRVADDQRDLVRERLQGGAITLSEVAGRPISPQTCADMIAVTANAVDLFVT